MTGLEEEFARAATTPMMVVLEAVADRAAHGASERVMHDTFLLLGLDLKDQVAVRATRDAFTSMVDRAETRKARGDAWRKGTVHGIVSLVVAGIAGFWGMKHG